MDETDTVQVLVAGEAVGGDLGGDQARGIAPVGLSALAVRIIAQALDDLPGLIGRGVQGSDMIVVQVLGLLNAVVMDDADGDDLAPGSDAVLVGDGAAVIGDLLEVRAQVPAGIEVNRLAGVVDLTDAHALGVVGEGVDCAALGDARGQIERGPGEASAVSAELVAVGIVSVADVLDAGGGGDGMRAGYLGAVEVTADIGLVSNIPDTVVLVGLGAYAAEVGAGYPVKAIVAEGFSKRLVGIAALQDIAEAVIAIA